MLSSVYRVSQEECARFRESVPYVKVYRYNPKHLYPKLNGYGDNGQRKVWSSCGSTHCTCSANLNESFPNRCLGRGGPDAWPPRSPDLTPLDYYLWGHMKTVYETKVESTAALRDHIFCSSRTHTQPSRQHCFCYSVPVDACRKLHSNWRRTLWKIAVKQVLYFSTVM